MRDDGKQFSCLSHPVFEGESAVPFPDSLSVFHDLPPWKKSSSSGQKRKKKCK
jgi:hypothetical protein